MLGWFADAPDPDAGLFGFRRSQRGARARRPGTSGCCATRARSPSGWPGCWPPAATPPTCCSARPEAVRLLGDGDEAGSAARPRRRWSRRCSPRSAAPTTRAGGRGGPRASAGASCSGSPPPTSSAPTAPRSRRCRRRRCGTARGGGPRGPPRRPARGPRRGRRRRGSPAPVRRGRAAAQPLRRRRAAPPPRGRAAAGRGRARPADSTRARFSAAAPSSRSSRRYQGVVPERVGHLAEAEQPGVRVGGVGEPAEQHRQQGALDGRLAADPGGQRLQVAQGGRRVGVAERLQPLAGRPPG